MNYRILDKCFKNATKNVYFIIFVIGVEYINIFFEIISITCRIIIKNKDEGIVRQLQDINPFYVIKNLQTCNRVGEYSLCTFSQSARIIMLVVIIVFMFLYYLNGKYEDEQKVTLASDKERKNFMARFFMRTSNFFANSIFVIFHFFGMFILFSFTIF